MNRVTKNLQNSTVVGDGNGPETCGDQIGQ